MPKRVQVVGDEDLLFPVQAFFNAIGDSSFLRIIANLASGIGAGIDDVYCEFPSDLNEDEETFEGVRCSLYEDEVVVDRDTFFSFLRLAAAAYIEKHPEESARVDAILSSMLR